MAVRCLIVDDSRCFVEAARPLLERGGITVVGAAFTLAEALRRIDELRPDVILLDIDLGGESGFEVVSRLSDRADRAPSDPRHPKIILISAHAEEDYKDLIEPHVEATHVVGFLAKYALSASAVYAVLQREWTSING